MLGGVSHMEIMFIGAGLIIMIFHWRKKIPARRWVWLILGLLGLYMMIFQPAFSRTFYKYTVAIGKEDSEVRKSFPSIPSFLATRISNEVDTIYLYGNQHDLRDVELLARYNVLHFPDTLSPGLEELNTPQAVQSEPFEIKGKITPEHFSELFLLDPSESLVKLEVDSDGYFREEVVAEVSGPMVYELLMINEKRDTLKEPIPIYIQEKEDLQLLVFLSAPSFELNYLKNFWVQQGQGFTQRMQVSQNDFRSIYFNAPERDLGQIDDRLIGEYDIIVLDIASWNRIGALARQNILQSVDGQGKGMVLLPYPLDEVPRGLPYLKPSKFNPIKWKGLDVTKVDFTVNKSWEPLSLDGKLIAYTLGSMAGKVVIPVIADTYKFLLANQRNNYQSVWAALFQASFVNRMDGLHVSSLSNLSAGQLSELMVEGPFDPETTVSSGRVFRPVPYIDSLGILSFVPLKGWNIPVLKDSLQMVYALGNEDRKTMKELEVIRYFESVKNVRKIEMDNNYKRKVPLPWWIGFIFFLAGFGMLWIEERVYGY